MTDPYDPTTVRDGVAKEIADLTEAAGGQAPDGQTIRDIIAKYARQGANGNPALEAGAEKRALEYYDQGISPETAASAAARQTYQDATGPRPTLAQEADRVLGYHDEDQIPDSSDIERYIADREVTIPAHEKAPLDRALADMREAFDTANIPEPLAAQAELAAVNAAAGGTVTSAGLDIDGNLNVTVHKDVELTFQDSQIKTTKLDTVYTHHSDVEIHAKDVKLTASKIDINALVEETNRVSSFKKSVRNDSSLVIGTFHRTNTPVRNNSLVGASLDASLVNFSFAPIKVGNAYEMSHHGIRRYGIKGVNYETLRNWKEKTKKNVRRVIAALIFI